ncbi:MAG TPA: methionine--tRNA ligase [Candidatus Paceibacterota bacterium]|nr:methionine--tRNA ligase [Candidatus Paceibacterota bacterium]
MENKAFYITTTLPYVNSDPHVGFAMEIIRADSVARYKKLQGYEVFFNTGTDEHGQKLLNDAQKAGKDVFDYVSEYAQKFRDLVPLLGISEDVHFIRTTDKHHEKAAQELWKKVSDAGFIYKKPYQTKYCVGCELEKTDSELVDGKCPIHPNKEIEIIDEENYFFAFSKVAPLLNELYKKSPNLVIPEFRFNEMKSFLERGLEDFSISRLKSKMSWGVPVPGDDEHVMYVWFDALTNYISTLGWPEDEAGNYKKFWESGEKVQFCGKDNTRQQSMMWQGMLLSAGLPSTNHIIINGFINSGGQKMSKSLGNVINPYDIVAIFAGVAGELSSDVLRYYLLRHMNSFEDSDMTMESINEAYQANLANGLGNLVSRIMTLSQTHVEEFDELPTVGHTKEIQESMEGFDIQKAMNHIWTMVGETDQKIQLTKPFSVIKEDKDAGVAIIKDLVSDLYGIAVALAPFMPKTSEKIIDLIRDNKKPEAPLFARLQ